jgi:FKBP-type peptidyl-prolyl cis-trans isomerase
MQVAPGIIKQIITNGNGPQVSKGNNITVHCTGYLAANEKKFWSTHDPGQQPFSFQCGLGKVIQGWDVGCLSMRQGERSKLRISSDKAYGPGGFPAWGIPQNADLIFDIEILSIS